MINRVREIAQYYCKSNMSEFARSIGAKQGAMASALERGSCSLDMALKILDTYSDVSAEWLLKGKGTMLKESTLTSAEVDELRGQIRELERRNAELENDKKMLQLLVNTLSNNVGVTLNNAQLGSFNTQNIGQ